MQTEILFQQVSSPLVRNYNNTPCNRHADLFLGIESTAQKCCAAKSRRQNNKHVSTFPSTKKQLFCVYIRTLSSSSAQKLLNCQRLEGQHWMLAFDVGKIIICLICFRNLLINKARLTFTHKRSCLLYTSAMGRTHH